MGSWGLGLALLVRRHHSCPLPSTPAASLCRRQRLHDNRARWQAGRSLRENLEAVLELALPQRAGADVEDASADCAICYAYRLPPLEGAPEGEEGERARGRAVARLAVLQLSGYPSPPACSRRSPRAGEAPEMSCDNGACGKPFHRRCLVEWLSSGALAWLAFLEGLGGAVEPGWRQNSPCPGRLQQQPGGPPAC